MNVPPLIVTLPCSASEARTGPFRRWRTGSPAIGLYLRRAGRPGYSGAHRFLHLQVLTLDEGGITRADGFHDRDLYAKLGLPAVLP